jgi:hypothetical protein
MFKIGISVFKFKHKLLTNSQEQNLKLLETLQWLQIFRIQDIQNPKYHLTTTVHFLLAFITTKLFQFYEKI